MTGVEIDLNFDWKVDKSFSAYMDPVKKNRLFKNALILACKKKNLGLQSQQQYDAIRTLIATEREYTVNHNILRLSPLVVNQVAIASGPTSTLIITTRIPHNLKDGDTVSFSGGIGLNTIPAFNFTQFTVASILSPYRFTITGFVNATGTYTDDSAKAITSNNVPDYGYLFAAKLKFKEQILGVKITGINDTTPIGIRIDGKSNLVSKEQIEFSIMGLPGANGTFYIKVVNSKLIELYADKNHQTPITRIGASVVQSGRMDRIYYKYATPYFSDRKIDPLGQPKPRKPKYAIADGALKCYPIDETCYAATLDYFTIPFNFIDVEDNILDLSTIYPLDFIYHIIDQAAKLYASQSRDQMLNQDMAVTLVQNP